MATNADDELKEYREEQKRQDDMAKVAEDKDYQVDADDTDLEPPELNEDGSLKETEDDDAS